MGIILTILVNFNIDTFLSPMTDINKVISKDKDFRSRDVQSESSLNLQQPIKIKIYGTHKWQCRTLVLRDQKKERYIKDI